MLIALIGWATSHDAPDTRTRGVRATPPHRRGTPCGPTRGVTPLGAPECMSDSLLCLSHAARCSHAPLRIVLPMLFMTLPAHPSLSTHALLCMWVHTATPQAEASASPPVGQHPTCAVRDGIVARRVSSWLVGCVRAHISSLSSSPHTQYMAGFGMPLSCAE